MRINYNVQAMRANLALNKADDKVSQSISKLSSGQKISAAKDNPSGYAMSKRMNLQIEGLSRATQSSNDAISVISIADGALQEVSEMIQRMSELSVQAANGTMADEDRQLCQDEIDQLKSEISRVASTTQFNGQTLMDGSFDLKGYTNANDIKVATYSDETPVQTYKIDSLNIVFDENGDIDLDKTRKANTSASGDSETFYTTGSTISDKYKLPDSAKIFSVDGKLLTITADNNFSITISVDEAVAEANKDNEASPYNIADVQETDASGAVTHSALELDITGLGAMDMQVGANEDQIIAIRIPELSMQLMSIDDLDVSSQEGAEKAINDLSTAQDYVNSMRSTLGAYQNRLEHTVSALGVTSESMTSAYSGLVDVDMSEETVTYTTQQVISQAATSILAQANDRPSQALQLLQ